VKRREFITLLGGTAAAWPLAAHGQQAPGVVIGFLGLTSQSEWGKFVLALNKGLAETGYVEGHNLSIEYRWADGQYDRLPAMASDLVRRKVAVIVTIAPPAALAAKAATTTIPIVFFMGSDPVQHGVVASLNRPGGNITGVTVLANEIGVKRLELLREIAPASVTAGVIALLRNPTNQNAEPDTHAARDAAAIVGQELAIVNASTEAEIDAVFEGFPRQRVAAVLINPDPFLLGRRDRIAALAMHHRLPTIFHIREPVVAGGLMSYGASFADAHRQAGIYVGRILKGERPGDLPVPQATKFELVINLKTAKALGLTVPLTLQASADEVIE
jgi:putative tryptophan/tyrosine transport system substrate-binding protein